jgi:hypothetical protein
MLRKGKYEADILLALPVIRVPAWIANWDINGHPLRESDRAVELALAFIANFPIRGPPSTVRSSIQGRGDAWPLPPHPCPISKLVFVASVPSHLRTAPTSSARPVPLPEVDGGRGGT